jgi:hypothetical protein
MLGAKTAVTIHDFSARLGTGEERPLADYRGSASAFRTNDDAGTRCA